ncbi:MAG: endonuclease domain-containing protein [Thermoanaerobaculia bacterium]
MLHGEPLIRLRHLLPSAEGRRLRPGLDAEVPSARNGSSLNAHARKRTRPPTSANACGAHSFVVAARSQPRVQVPATGPVGPYILDFYCAELELAIELDGPQHNTLHMSDYDSARTVFLHERGIEVLRIPNELTDGGGEYAMAWIKNAIAQRATG